MAEFISTEEATNKFASSGKGNAGLALGIIGTALGALGSLGSGSNILGLGNNSKSSSTSTEWDLARQQNVDQQSDIYQIQEAKIEALKELANLREKDIAEKADVYRQSRTDNNRLETMINDNRYNATQAQADLYNQVIKNDKDLEIKIESHRETDIQEKFDMYKELNNQTNKLAYDSMRQSYEDRMEAFNAMNNLSSRISALETATAVNSATQPLMFKLSEATTQAQLNTKVTGSLGIKWDQVYGPNLGPVPFVPPVYQQN